MSEKSQIGEVLIHPVYNQPFVSSEHPKGQLNYNGDALGRDCIIVKKLGGWIKMYVGNGSKNEDWYGWDADVLAPFDSIIESVFINDIINFPGINPGGRASHIIFKRTDDIRVLYAHVKDVAVNKGDVVKAGDTVAKVGNNGASCMPHIHIGAWSDNGPLQIRFDLKSMGIIMNQFYGSSSK